MSKASKLRACPVAGRQLTPAECGNHRTTRYACPADCAYSPFIPANYDQLSAIDAEALAVTMRRLESEPGHAERRRRVEEWARAGNLVALDAEAMWAEHGETDAMGRTFMDRWVAEGYGPLRNDVRVVLERRRQLRPMLFEVHVIRDDRVVEGVDLLDPARPTLTVVDRGLAARVNRFTALFCFLYPLPHYLRMVGTAMPMPAFHPFPAAETLFEVVRHLGGPTGTPEFRSWSMRNFPRIVESLRQAGEVRRRIVTLWKDRAAEAGPGELERPGRPSVAVPESVPPRLLEDFPPLEFLRRFEAGEPGGDAEAAARAEFLRAFPDCPEPFLHGATPRVATDDPALRARLLVLLKCLIRGCDEFTLATGLPTAVDGLVRDLGVSELQVPPPPERPKPDIS